MSATPKLPDLLKGKIDKTGQTRGADDDVIYQNRVNRNNTVLIPYHWWRQDWQLKESVNQFEKGYIVLISPKDYFDYDDPTEALAEEELELGHNCLIFYETRHDWNLYNPEKYHFKVATSRNTPLGGEYVARVPATTASEDSEKIIRGFADKPKGAGIRLYEYASKDTIKQCKLQLEAIFWHCEDAIDVVVSFGMTRQDAELRKRYCLEKCNEQGLLNYNRLIQNRILNPEQETICPLCLKKLSGNGFFNRLEQPQGREVPDLTVTQINLFHIDELKYGEYNHKPYNLGWGHHHCNVVVKDSGIDRTLEWMQEVIDRNIAYGYLSMD